MLVYVLLIINKCIIPNIVRINNFKEMGLLSRWTSKWMPRGRNKQEKKTGATKATLNDIQGAMYI